MPHVPICHGDVLLPLYILFFTFVSYYCGWAYFMWEKGPVVHKYQNDNHIPNR